MGLGGFRYIVFMRDNWNIQREELKDDKCETVGRQF